MTTATIAIKRIFLEDLVANPDNPRRITDKHASLPSLAQSLREMGQVQPIVVRPILDGPDEITGYQIVAGERRWRAAKLAGLEQLDCIVRELDDQQAFSICVVENLQREDLHWLEEARGVAAMVAKGWGIETIAKEIGKSAGWVHLRAKLSEISPKWVKAIDEEEEIRGWPIGMLELVARLPIETQDAMLREEHRWNVFRASSVADLRKGIERDFMHLLSAAPFPIDAGNLVPKAGACTACPKRSGCQQALFEDRPKDSCLDAVCWNKKAESYAKMRLQDLKALEPKALTVAAKGLDYREICQLPDGTLSGSDYEICKAEAKGAKPAIVMAPGKEPKLVHVTLEEEAPRSAHGTPAPAKDRLQDFLLRRQRECVRVVRELLGLKEHDNAQYAAKVKLPGIKGRQPTEPQIMALALTVWDNVPWSFFSESRSSTRSIEAEYTAVMKLSAEQILDRLWLRTKHQLREKLETEIRTARFESEGSHLAQLLCRVMNVTWKTVVATVQDQMPLPRSLASSFDEDGTKKTGVSSPAKTAKPKKKALAAAKA